MYNYPLTAKPVLPCVLICPYLSNCTVAKAHSSFTQECNQFLFSMYDMWYSCSVCQNRCFRTHVLWRSWPQPDNIYQMCLVSHVPSIYSAVLWGYLTCSLTFCCTRCLIQKHLMVHNQVLLCLLGYSTYCRRLSRGIMWQQYYVTKMTRWGKHNRNTKISGNKTTITLL